ncbi:hypothetical protein Q4Q34_07780 [Flavivirga abyssicola]|uniref:hypothetical protein n=1 Tax=Flavivirga abyssicola TaxID=3063533 RepID=UPI0026DFBDE8|nr:hypothetical protein [Flavivirga sp. MEBiC07777]WVK14925.1 hypothetical protein Q4Q34_07780 [Flavivirga sp. MEBiC07777]
MPKYLLIIAFIVVITTGCKTASIFQESQTSTKQQVPLGGVGLEKDFMLQQGFNSTATPKYAEPVKISALIKPFTKQVYKSFLKAKVSQSADVAIDYVDSLEVKPKFIQLKIADKVTLIKSLNNNNNREVKDYLSHNKAASIVSSISIAFSKQDLKLIQQADAVFLVESGMKNYALQLYQEGKKKDLIQFNKGIVFAYKTANCCWQENKRHQIHIVDLVNEFSHCPNKTYRNSERAKKEIKLF